jgi:hypothetical protein
MNTQTRPLRTVKRPSAEDTAKLAIERAGLSPSLMSKWADQNVIRLLNLKPNVVTNRVTAVVELCRRAGQLVERMYDPSSASVDRTMCEERNQVLEDLNGRLAKYKWHPVARMGLSPRFRVTYEFKATSDGAAFENRAVHWLMEHIDVVHRIRRCRRCSIWFFAVTDHQKYCGGSCRKQDASQGESFKEKRKAYMRQYRIDQAERDAQAKRLAKGKSK